MKRILALTVSLLIAIASVFSVTAIAADDSIANLDKEVTILNQLGYVKTVPEDLNTTITRGEFAQILLDMMKGDIVEPTGAVITDINEFHDYYPAMNRAIKLGLVTGPVTRADDPVTYDEAIKMTICMLGYNQYAIHKGGWPSGYRVMARNIGLTQGIDNVGNISLVFEDAIKLLYNAITIDVLEPVYIGETVTYGTIEGRTILVQSHNIIAKEGLVEAVNGKAIYGDNVLPQDVVIIDGKKYTTDFNNIGDYVGQNVIYYYDDNTSVLRAFYPENNNIATVDAESVYELEGLDLIYDDENGKEQKISFSQKAIILYNDVIIDGFDSSYFKDKQGVFTFVDNDNDGKYDIVFLDVTEDYVVKIADSSSGIVYDYYDTSRTVCLSDEGDINVKFVDEFGNEMRVSELMRHDVISVKRGLDGKNVTAIYSNTEVRGNIESVSNVSGKLYININGKRYETTTEFAKYEKLKLGEFGVFGITTTGKIASINRGFASEGSYYGYLINGKKTSGLDGQYKFRILSQTNEVHVLTFAEKINVDGVNLAAENAYAYLGGDKLESQPIVFEVDKYGFICRIDTVNYKEDSENRDSLREMYNGWTVSYDEDGNKTETSKQTLEWRSSTGIFGSKIATTSNTVLFKVASTNDAPNEEYSASSISSLASANTYYTIKAYKTIEDSHMADIIVLYSSQVSASAGNATYVISNVSEILDENENAVIQFELRSGSNTYRYNVKDKSVLKSAKWYGAKNSDAALEHEFVVGDIVKLTRDTSGYINNMELIYDRVAQKFYSTSYYNIQNANSEFRISFNEVYSIYSNNILVHKGPIPEGTESLDYSKLESYNTGGFSILVYDSKNKVNPVRKGVVADLSDYKTTGKGSMIFIQSAYTTNGQIIVYKY